MTTFLAHNDRFVVSYALALVLHVSVLLGVGFVLDFKPLTHPLETLDVVLVNWRSESEPDDADFLAQVSQRGGGESAEVQRPSQDNVGRSAAPVQGEDQQDQEAQLSVAAEAVHEQILIEAPDNEHRQQITTIAQPEPPLPSAASLLQASKTMAKLQPGIQYNRDSLAKLPRRKWISANTREYEYAAYMQAWVSKVERVGNLNYPDEIRRQKLVGDLLMSVGINRDGSVESIEILRSSGLQLLDQCATRIVRLGAPYSPLPEHINATVDVLHITRTWRFSRDFQGLD